jgi:hypothetical protein
VKGLASAATAVDDDDGAGRCWQFEQLGDGADDSILGWKEPLLDASNFTHGVLQRTKWGAAGTEFLPLIRKKLEEDV